MDQSGAPYDNNLPPGFGINLIGHFTTHFGLGIAAYAIAALLRRRGVPFTLYHVPHCGIPGTRLPGFESHWVSDPGQLVYPVNLYTVSIVPLTTIFETIPALLQRDRMHVATIWWEASHIPPGWREPLARFDAILAFSDFIAEVARNSLPPKPVLRGAYPLNLPADIRGDCRRFGVRDDTVLFVSSLNPNSDPVRKNPTALVIAFRVAFPPEDTGVRLIIRLHNGTDGIGVQVARQLRRLMHGDDRIELSLEPMEYEEVLSLYACADIYLSLHRAEGLGLGMLESMTLGKPVIATGWSGNMSFMDHGNSAPLRYRLVPVAGSFDFYQTDIIGPEAQWAEPMLDDTVIWMRRLRQDPDLRRELASRAESSALAYRKQAEAAEWVDELAGLWQGESRRRGDARNPSSRS